MKRNLFLYIINIPSILFCFSCQSPATHNEKKEATKMPSSLPQNSQTTHLSTKDAVTAAEKKFNEYLPNILTSHDAALDIMESHTGDFTGDGVDDVAIYFSLSPQGGGNALVGQGLTLYKNTGSDIQVIGGFEPDYIFTFDTISDGHIQITKLEYADGDGHCCPSIRTGHTLTISGSTVE